MPGILANSSSKVMLAADSAVDNAESGYVTSEQIVLTTSPTGAAYTWGLAIPSGSAVARSGLSSTSGPSPAFRPDVAGNYTITCTVDGATYVLRCAVTATSPISVAGAITFPPVTDASVAAPATGITIYNSIDQGGMVQKDSAGTISEIDITGV